MKRFTSKIVQLKSGCWEWTAALRGKTGYGAFKNEGKVIDAHRFSFMLFKGKIIPGKLVCHTCDSRKCVNPDHLVLRTAKENHQAAVSKGRIAPNLNVHLQKHPSLGAYSRGCRCSACKMLQVQRVQRYRHNLSRSG